MAFDSSSFSSGLGGLIGGLFGDKGKPYDKAMQQYMQYNMMGQGMQQPYYNAGLAGMGNYMNWLEGQKDPTQFINSLMKNYQQSPYTSYLQQQSQAAGENAASASGLMGSTPFLQQQQQNAGNIAQQGLDSWLQNVLGINRQYGQGQQNLMQGGQGAANNMSQMMNQLGQFMAEQGYNKEASKQNNFWNTIGSGLELLGSFL